MKPATARYHIVLAGIAVFAASQILFATHLVAQTDSSPPEEIAVSPPTTPSPLSATELGAQAAAIRG